MQKNVGGYDRIIRFIVGPILIVAGAAVLLEVGSLSAGTAGQVLAVLAILIGAVLTVTATTQKCPLNSVIGLNTHRGRSSEQSSPDEPRSGIE